MCGELDGGLRHILPEDKPDGVLTVKDAIADAFLQRILLRPAEYGVSAPINFHGDHLSGALARPGVTIPPQPVGSRRMNMAPPSARRRASKRAPCSWAMRATIARPRPVPRGLVLR